MSTPPPLDPESYQKPHGAVEMHDHAVHTYENERGLVAPLAAFINEGLDRKELSVFVHSFPTEAEAWALVEKARPDALNLRRDQIVLVSLYRDAFQGDRPKIDYDHVKSVVDSLISSAQGAGRAGVRIFVDASRRYFSEGRAREWFDFETWLGRRLQQRVGLVCAYQRSDVMKPDVFHEVLKTHAYRFDA